MPDSSRMRPRHRARILGPTLLRETGPYHAVSEKLIQEWIPFPRGYTPAYRRPEGQPPEPQWEIRLAFVQPSLDYETPDAAFRSHQQLPQPLHPGEPSEWIELPEPTQQTDSDSVYSEETNSASSARPHTPVSVSEAPTEDEQALEISGFQGLPCCKKHRVHRPKPDHGDSLTVTPAQPVSPQDYPVFSCRDPVVQAINPPHPDLLNVNNVWLGKMATGYKIFPPRNGARIYRKTKPNLLLDQIVKDMIQEGMLLKVDRLACAIPWFLVAKPDGAARLTCDYSQWTGHYKIPEMKLKNIPLVLQNSSLEDYAVKLDLKSVFFHLKLHPDCWSFHGLHYGEQKYVFTRVPMENSLSPYIMQRTAEALLLTLSEIYDFKLATHAYLNDWLLASSSPQLLQHVTDFLLQSVTINKDKSVLIPTQQITYIGLEIDFRQGAVFPSDKTIRKAKQLADALPDLGFHARREAVCFLNWLFYQLNVLLFPVINALFGSFTDLRQVNWKNIKQSHQVRPSYKFFDVYTDATPTQGSVVIPSLNKVEIFKWPNVTLEINAAETMSASCGLMLAIRYNRSYNRYRPYLGAYRFRCHLLGPPTWLWESLS